MTTIFSRIIAREIPASFIYEDDVCVVILDAFPAIEGQTLIIPKMEVDYIFDLPKDIYQHILDVSKKIALTLDKVYNTKRTCLVVEGFEVPHVHIKLYPMTEVMNLNKLTMSPTTKPIEELNEDSAKISAELRK